MKKVMPVLIIGVISFVIGSINQSIIAAFCGVVLVGISIELAAFEDD